MGLIDQKAANLFGVGTKKVRQPEFKANDFPEGFIILEYKNGQPIDNVILKGPFMPHVPFQFGGEQRLVTEYYPGNSEPTVQVLGPKEKELTIKGHFRLKKFKRQILANEDGEGKEDPTIRETARAYQEQIDIMRLRGNLVRLQMGEWHRWGFIKECNFEFRTLAEINYEIQFIIIGFNPPKNSRVVGEDTKMDGPNKELITAAIASIDSMQAFPTEMPQGITDFLNDQISEVAGAIGLVTTFVDDILTDVEKLNASVNRALGLVKNARATISTSMRRIGAISNSLSNLGSSFASEWQKSIAQINSINHLHETKRQMFSLMSFLAALQKRFEKLSQTVPMFRHLVTSGDTLQNISIKYYHTPDNWKKIYDHNRLTTTELERGSILEIPRG